MATKKTATEEKKVKASSKSAVAKAAAKKKPAKASDKQAEAKQVQPAVLKLVKNDEWLAPYADAINGRHEHALAKIQELVFHPQEYHKLCQTLLY